MRTVAFPGLGLEFHLSRMAFSIFGFPVYWYGIIIAAGFLLAIFYCCRKAPQLGLKSDDFIDLLFFAVPLAIVGARLYYIIFYLDFFRRTDGTLDFLQMVRIWDGGLAIYGGVIAGVITALIFCKIKKLKFSAFADLLAFGLLIGQCIGRWGNFVNIEAYGSQTTLPWRMGVYEFVSGAWQYVEVHPTFLYESLWNLAGFILLAVIAKNWRKFDGQIFLCYLAWYGLGRGLIEGLRTDSLYFFQTGLRVSQILGFASAVIALLILAFHLVLKRHRPENLWVHQVAARVAAKEAIAREAASVTQAATALDMTEALPNLENLENLEKLEKLEEDKKHGSDSN